MSNISKSVARVDNTIKTSGELKFLADYPREENELIAKALRSAKPRAKILSVNLPQLPKGYYYVDRHDIPAEGDNHVIITINDHPVFAEDIVEYVGEAIGLIVGPDEKVVKSLVKKINVEYEELDYCVDMDKSETVLLGYDFSKGDYEKAFAEADFIFEETIKTGLQEQAYMEKQGALAIPLTDNRMCIRGTMQCPYYVKKSVCHTLGCEDSDIQVIQENTGGGFGGKEDYPSIIATQVAVAAKKINQPVRFLLDVEEDMEVTTKRHPSASTYKVAVKDGKVTGMDILVKYNCGAYGTVSTVVLQRGLISSPGVYVIENLNIKGLGMKTNAPPNGAFRGFGAPQTFFAVEVVMNHLAEKLGVDPYEFKTAHMAYQGGSTSTSGKFHFPVPLTNMIAQIDKEANYHAKRKEYAKPQTGRYRKGIGMSLVFHGAGFTGNGERDYIGAVARLKKREDDYVEILVANTEMGQGLKTALTKIVARELELPFEKILYANPDTDVCPDSGPTVASRSTMIVSELLRRAAIKLKAQWIDGKEIDIYEKYKHPDFMIPFDLETFKGDAYPTFAWCVNAVEVEIDVLTGYTTITDAYGSYDLGTPIDENILTAQMEGGFLQGLGQAAMEIMNVDANGHIRNNNYSDYTFPTAVDVKNMKCMLFTEEYPLGPFGAKGGGELPNVGPPAAYIQAMEQALGGYTIDHIPFTTEEAMEVLESEGICV